MSLLLENHLVSLDENLIPMTQKSLCWEILHRTNVLCPAHEKEYMDCWLIPKTPCTNFIGDDFFHKLGACLTCSYFVARSKRHPGGWNDFVSEQLHRYHSRALERIYQKEESFVDILNRLPDGLFTTDHELRITYFNPAAEKITGFSADDAVGMYCKDVLKNSICEYDCVLKRTSPEGRDIHSCEYEITNIDGKKIRSSAPPPHSGMRPDRSPAGWKFSRTSPKSGNYSRISFSVKESTGEFLKAAMT